jgi:serine/threonine-protein kinase
MYGRLDERIGIENKMLEIDPLDAITRIDLINDLFYVGRYEEALASARRLTLLSPSAFSVHAAMAFALLYLGRRDEALAAARAEPDEAWRLQALPVAFWALGRKADSDAALKEAETKYAADLAYNIAEMHAYRGELDSAFRWLDRAYQQHDAGMIDIRVDPLLQNLRKDPRYKAVLVRMKLEGGPPADL